MKSRGSMKTRIKINSNIISITLEVYESSDEEVLLSTDFFVKAKASLKYENNEICIGDSCSKFIIKK